MKYNVDKLGAVGVITDAAASELPPNAWDSLLNLRCEHGHIEPMDGYADVTTMTPPGSNQDVHCHALESIETSTNFYWVFPYDDDDDGQAEAIYQYNGSTVTDITRTVGDGGAYAGASSDLWNTCAFNGVIVLNNGSDNPQYWDGASANCGNLPWDATFDWDDIDGTTHPYHAKVIRSFKNVLFAGNITDDTTVYPQMVHWSAIADPGALPIWDYSLATNESGRRVLSGTDGAVLDFVPLDEQLICYKEDAIYSFLYTGGQSVFTSRLVTAAYGLWGTNCAVDRGGIHVCLGDGVLYEFDGREPRDILYGRGAEAFFAQIDPDAYEKVFLVHNKEEEEVWICYPEIGDSWAKKALIYNYASGAIYYRTIPPSAIIKPGLVVSSDGDAWDDGSETTLAWDAEDALAWEERTYSPIGDTLVAASDQLEQFGVGVTSDTVEAIRTNIVIDDPTVWFFLREMRPRATGAAFNITVGGQKFIDGPVVWNTTKAFDPGTQRKLNWRQSYPVQAIQITFTGASPFRLAGYTVEGEVQAQR